MCGCDMICVDFKCVQKPTKSQISLTSAAIEQNKNLKQSDSPWNHFQSVCTFIQFFCWILFLN